MTDPFVHVERRPDGVALVRLDRPKANALSVEVLGQILSAASALHDDPPGAVVLWGGRRIFAAGAEIAELGEEGGAATVGASFHRALDALAGLPRATIAAINGYALGGGLELALACDFRVCAQDSRLGLPEVLLGLLPGGGGTQRLPRLIGSSRAKELIMTGRHAVHQPDDVLDVALEWAAALARGPLVAHGLAKAAIDSGLDGTLAHGLEAELAAFSAVARTEDAGRGIASFAEHGPGRATFVGR
jgi:enoyl-CoA hydratase/carnithine racemase